MFLLSLFEAFYVVTQRGEGESHGVLGSTGRRSRVTSPRTFERRIFLAICFILLHR